LELWNSIRLTAWRDPLISHTRDRRGRDVRFVSLADIS
jgi:hypothetical protein